MSAVGKRPAGKRCVCPTCAFAWTRPANENGKPCPKCQTPFNDTSVPRSPTTGVAKKPAIPRTGAAPAAPRSPQPTSPAPVAAAPVEVKAAPAVGSTSPKRSVSPKKGGGDIFSRLTDTSRYTGAHKARFNADGTGRGLAGRDSVNKGAGTSVGSITGGAHSGIGAKRSSGTRTGKMTCPTCGYSWSRPAGEGGRPCPKCNNPV